MKPREPKPIGFFFVLFAVLIAVGLFVRSQHKEGGQAPAPLPEQAQAATQSGGGDILKFGKFKNPLALAADSRGQLYVLEGATPPAVRVFSPQGDEIKSQTISSMPENGSPNLMAVADDGAVFVARARSRQVTRIAPDGTRSPISQFNMVLGLAVSGQELWVLGAPNEGLVHLDLNGKQLSKVPVAPYPTGDFQGLRIGAQKDFYTYAAREGLVYHFGADGKLIAKIGGGDSAPPKVGLAASYVSSFFDVDKDGAVFWSLGDYGALLQITGDGIHAVHYRSRDTGNKAPVGTIASLAGFVLVGDRAYVLDRAFNRISSLPKSLVTVYGPDTDNTDARIFGYDFRLVSDQPYKLFTTPEASLKIAFEAGNRMVHQVQVHIDVLDLKGEVVERQTATLDVPGASATKVALPPLKLPRYGWYQLETSLSSPGSDEAFLRNVQYIGRTFVDDSLPIPDKEYSGWLDVRTHRMAGLGLMRFALQQYKQVDEFGKELALARAMKVPYYVLFIHKEDCTPEKVRYVLDKLKSYGDDAPKIELVNEPDLNRNAASYIQILKNCVDTVRQVSPGAQIMGPSQCGIRLDWFEQFLQGGGGDIVDIVTQHTYERHNSMDVYHWQKKFTQMRELMEKYHCRKPVYITEHGFMGDYIEKITRPQWQARQLTLEQNVLDRFGIGPDKYLYYYLNYSGYRDYSAYLVDRNHEMLPAVLMTRTRAHFLQNRAFERAVDLGAPGNWLLIANQYKGMTVLQNCGALQDVPVQVSGAARAYDCFGNEMKLAGTLPVGRYPVYVEAAPGAKVDVKLANFGKDIAPQAKVICEDPKGSASSSKLTNGLLEFDFHGEPERVGLLASDGKLPLDVTLQWSAPQKISQAILYASMADNDKSTPLDYDVQAHQNGSWKTIDSIRQTPYAGFFAIGTMRITDYDNPWIFLHRFSSPVTTDALRFHFTRTTRGQFPTDKIADSLAPFLKQRVELREVQVFTG